jgi:hypothetical protein
VIEEFFVAAYLFDQRPDGRYVPKVSIRRHGRPEIVITDPEGRTYRDLNRARRWTSGCSTAGGLSTHRA